jgi:hypothetical protein
MSAVIENHHDDHDHGPAKGIFPAHWTGRRFTRSSPT